MSEDLKLKQICAFDAQNLTTFCDVRNLHALHGLVGAIADDERSLDPIRDDLAHLQTRLWRSQTRSVVIVIQGLDAAGKDGMIRHVFNGLNPSGFRVSAFKKPTGLEQHRYYLSRYIAELPAQGCMAAFNRSYYEDVIVPSVHPESLGWSDKQAKAHVERRLNEINQLEQSWTAEGIEVVKFFLNVSYRVQGERLLARLDDPHKRYKFSSEDVVERRYFQQYLKAIKRVLGKTHTPEAPWMVIPADHKPTVRALVGRLLRERLTACTHAGEVKARALSAPEQRYKAELKRSL